MQIRNTIKPSCLWRRIRWTPMVLGVLLSGGCLSLSKPPKVPQATGKILDRRAQDFVGYLNRQADDLQTVRYEDVSISAKVPGQWIPRLSNSMIVCGKPNNFRMTAGAIVGGNQLDVGSNSQEMWMYVKMAKTPFVYCSQADFPKVQESLPVKFEPSWVLQALGMASYDPQRDYTVTVSDRDRSYLLSYPDTTSTGETVYKVTEFAADEAAGSLPQVRRHVILSRDRKTVIAEARINKVSDQVVGRDPQSGASQFVQVPVEVTLEWPKEQVKMDLSLGRISINEKLSQEQLEKLFVRPRQIGDATPVNLAEYLSDPRTGKELGSRR